MVVVSHLLGCYPEHSNLIRPFDKHLTQSSGLLSLQLTAQGKRLRLTNFHPQFSPFYLHLSNSTPGSVTQRWGEIKASLILKEESACKFSRYYSSTVSWCRRGEDLIWKRFNLVNLTLHLVSPNKSWVQQNPSCRYIYTVAVCILEVLLDSGEVDSLWKVRDSFVI